MRPTLPYPPPGTPLGASKKQNKTGTLFWCPFVPILVPKSSPKEVQNRQKTGQKSEQLRCLQKYRFLTYFGAFLRGPNTRSVWYVQCLLENTAFGKRSFFDKICHKKLHFGSQNATKSDQKRVVNTAWIFGCVFVAFWHHFVSILGAKSGPRSER